VAAHHQYRDDGRDISRRVPDPEYAEPRCRAIHLKLDEITKSIDQAQNEMIDIEHLSDDELQRLADKYQKVREECDSRSSRRKKEAAKES
jgi:low affinity Fe/Cu permease